jgi:pimeloyl-ACP methyl ester carboxylesterase
VPRRVLWLTPADPSGPQRSFDAVAAALGDAASPVLKGLEVWRSSAGDGYGMATEVAAVRALVGEHSPVHLFGFSAGATVALATALELSGSVCSVAVYEPATIGDDEWSPVEADFRAAVRRICTLQPPSARATAFAELMLPPGRALPPSRREPPPWDDRRDRLEEMLDGVGFVSDDLARLAVPCLVLTGGDSHPRFRHLADRLVDVVPHARAVTYEGASHLEPPMRERPAVVAHDLLAFWTAAERAGPEPSTHA